MTQLPERAVRLGRVPPTLSKSARNLSYSISGASRNARAKAGTRLISLLICAAVAPMRHLLCASERPD